MVCSLSCRVIAVILCGLALIACAQESELDDRSCESSLVLDTTFSVAQSPGDRSFQAHASFDGKAIWLTHAHAPLVEENIVVSALRVHCDGSVAQPATRLPVQSGLQTEPRIASSGDRVLMAWQRDDQVSAQNLSTHYLLFDRDLGPEGVSTKLLDTQYKGQSAGNTWMPALAASQAGFVIAGLRGVSDFQSFQSFAQRLDVEGNMVGAAIDSSLQDERSQDSVSALLDEDGNVILAHTQTDADGESHVLHQWIASDDEEATDEPVLASRTSGAMSSQGGSEAGNQFIAYATSAGSVAIKSSGVFNPDDQLLLLRDEGGTPVGPKLAIGTRGSAAVWLEPLSGYNAEIHLQAFRDSGARLERAGPALRIATDAPAIAPYGIDIAHIQEEVYVVTWTEGPVSDLRVKWRLVDLQAE